MSNSFFTQPNLTDPLADKIDLTALDYTDIEYLGGCPDAGRSTYKVFDSSLNCHVVIKIALFHCGNWDSIRQLSEGEFRALQAVDDSQVPKVIKHLEPDGKEWIGLSMEYIEGSALSDTSLAPSEVVELANSLVKTLVAIQKQQIIHLDIKPENIIRRDTGDYVLVDFGVSKKFKASTTTGLASTVLGGTIGFTDPNVLFLRKKPTLRSDLYSVGCTLAALLFGLSTSSFIEEVGLTPVSTYLQGRGKPKKTSSEFWQWLLTLVDLTGQEQPTNAQEAMDCLEAALRKSKLTPESAPVSPVLPAENVSLRLQGAPLGSSTHGVQPMLKLESLGTHPFPTMLKLESLGAHSFPRYDERDPSSFQTEEEFLVFEDMLRRKEMRLRLTWRSLSKKEDALEERLDEIESEILETEGKAPQDSKRLLELRKLRDQMSDKLALCKSEFSEIAGDFPVVAKQLEAVARQKRVLRKGDFVLS